MPLKIRIKPEAKIFAGGAVLKNVGKHAADLLVLSDSPVLREEYMMNMDRRADSDVTNVYFLLQIIYLFRGKDQPMDTLVIDTVRSFGRLYPAYADTVAVIIQHLEAGESFKALKITHDILKQYEKEHAKDGNPPSGDPALPTKEPNA